MLCRLGYEGSRITEWQWRCRDGEPNTDDVFVLFFWWQMIHSQVLQNLHQHTSLYYTQELLLSSTRSTMMPPTGLQIYLRPCMTFTFWPFPSQVLWQLGFTVMCAIGSVLRSRPMWRSNPAPSSSSSRKPPFSFIRGRKTLISNRGRWSPLSLFRQVHLGVGKSENNLPSQGYELLQPGKQ